MILSRLIIPFARSLSKGGGGGLISYASYVTHLKREDTTMLIYVHKTPILGTDIGIQRASQSVVETGPTEGGGFNLDGKSQSSASILWSISTDIETV